MLTRSKKAWIYSGDWGWTVAPPHFAQWVSDARRELKLMRPGLHTGMYIVNNLVDPLTGVEFHISLECDSAGVITRQQLTRHDFAGTYWDIKSGFDRPTVPGETGFLVHELERD
jgi:hypothetical protein